MSGPPSKYDTHDDAQIESALDDELGDLSDPDDDTAPETESVTIEGRLEFAGETIRRNNGVRTVTFRNVDIRPVITAKREADQARDRANRARPARSYTAKTWQAQFRALGKMKRGDEAQSRAGLNVTRRTLREWERGTRAPSKANRAKIERAYGSLATWNVDSARENLARARRNLTDKLTQAVQDTPGVGGATVRLLDIRNITFGDE